jgi:uncharacterized protein (DUF1499 family)
MIAHISTYVVLCLASSILMAGCTGVRPSGLGVKDNKLAPCPSSPNCVSSQAGDQEHFVPPLAYAADTPATMANLKKIILGMKRSRIVTETGNYLHAEFTSAIWRFVDDVEFYADENARVMHVRSASRLGTSDFGVNRKRVETIREAWKALEK